MNAREWAGYMLNERIGDDSSRFVRWQPDKEFMTRVEKVGGRLYTEELTQEDAVLLAERAIVCSPAWEALAAVVYFRLRHGLALPKALSEFASLIVAGAKPPKRRGTPRLIDRDECIASVIVGLCHAYDLNPTRNPASYAVDSATSIVAEVMRNPTLAESAVVTIWQKSMAKRRYEKSD